MPGQYENVTGMGFNFGNGDDNPSGVGENGFFIPTVFFAANGIKKPSTLTTAEGLVTISTAHVLAAGKAPIPLITMMEKAGFNFETVGELLSFIYGVGAEVFIPSLTAGALGTAQALKNYRGIFFFPKLGTSHYYQIGSEEISAKFEKISGGSGVGPTGAPGIAATIKSYSTSPVFLYTAGIPAPGA